MVPRRDVCRRAITAAVVTAGIVIGALAVGPGAAWAKGSGYYVTFVARSCPSYQDVFANKARNDIQESLDDLGPDSPYNDTVGLVDPAVESRAPEDACSPLPQWQFTLGHGYLTRAVTGPWGSLSEVTDPFAGSSIVTQASTPLYDQYHNRVKGQSIAGAVTIQLTDDERKQAAAANRLWAQGGTPDDPVLANTFPGPEYGFAALRCATDALNGDNVEYVFFPAGVTHVFCYAFYVVPPPTSGTITIQKRVVGAPDGEDPAFGFNGSISFNPDGFTLANGQSLDFYRAGGQTWEVTEAAVDHYTLSSVDCTATTDNGQPGSSTATMTGATTEIHLVDAEHVTCVYTNTYQPPPGGLVIDKTTRNGTGRFTYTVAPAAAGGRDFHVAATTRRPRVPASAAPELSDLAPGRYTITETSRTSDEGRWRTVSVVCNGVREKPGEPVQVTVQSGQTSTCGFVDAFIAAGAISLAKITTGSTGSVAFLIGARGGKARQFSQHATTTEEGVAADAVPNRSTDATDHLPLGRYLIVEQAPPSEDANDWALQSVQCNGQLIPFSRGAIAVTLTPAHPRLRCVFTDRFIAQPPPDPSPPPTPIPPSPPTPSDGGRTPAYEGSDLSVAKQALTPEVVSGQAVSYRITVHNRGPDAAANVVLVDQPQGRATLLSVTTSKGTCNSGKLIVCRLGNLAPRATVAIMVRLIPRTSAARFSNRAVVGGGTAEATLANNSAQATIRVLHPPAHPIACSSSLSPVARAAC